MSNRAFYSVFIIVGAMVVSGCGTETSRGGYESFRTVQRYNCLRLPPGQYEDCIKDANIPYADYEREREELLNSSD